MIIFDNVQSNRVAWPSFCDHILVSFCSFEAAHVLSLHSFGIGLYWCPLKLMPKIGTSFGHILYSCSFSVFQNSQYSASFAYFTQSHFIFSKLIFLVLDLDSVSPKTYSFQSWEVISPVLHHCRVILYCQPHMRGSMARLRSDCFGCLVGFFSRYFVDVVIVFP